LEGSNMMFLLGALPGVLLLIAFVALVFSAARA
jgi:flagellar biogenesis protein FliO